MCEYRLPLGKYHAVRHITCAIGANIDLHIIPSSTADATAVPLPHKDFFKIGGRLVWVKADATVPLLHGDCFAIGKVYPTKLGKAERAKVGVDAVSRRDGARSGKMRRYAALGQFSTYFYFTT